MKKIGISLPVHPKFNKLDIKTKEQVKEIIEKVKVGKMTKAEADVQLKKLGVTLPEHNENRSQINQLDDQTKENADKLIQHRLWVLIFSQQKIQASEQVRLYKKLNYPIRSLR